MVGFEFAETMFAARYELGYTLARICDGPAQADQGQVCFHCGRRKGFVPECVEALA